MRDQSGVIVNAGTFVAELKLRHAVHAGAERQQVGSCDALRIFELISFVVMRVDPFLFAVTHRHLKLRDPELRIRRVFVDPFPDLLDAIDKAGVLRIDRIRSHVDIDDIDCKYTVGAVIVEPELHLREIIQHGGRIKQTADRKPEFRVCLFDACIRDRPLVAVVIRGAHRGQLVRREIIGLAAPSFIRFIGIFKRLHQTESDLRLRAVRNIECIRIHIRIAAVARRDLIHCLRMDRIACRIRWIRAERNRDLRRLFGFGDCRAAALKTRNDADSLRLHCRIVAVHVAPCALRELHFAVRIKQPAQVVVFADIAAGHDRGHRVVDKRIEADALPC